MCRATTPTRVIAFCLLAATGPVRAEVLASSPGHYHLHHEGRSVLPPEQLWQRLLSPSSWWSPAHTYSGDANNLTLDARVGGYWQETWESGAVAHGRVMLIQAPKTLRLEAPFGPLQALGAYTVWTISLIPDNSGTRVVFDETSVAPESADLGQIAPAVDGVKNEAMQRLIDPSS